MGEWPPQRSTETVGSTTRRNGDRNGTARPDNGDGDGHGATPVLFVCSRCRAAFANGTELQAHRAAGCKSEGEMAALKGRPDHVAGPEVLTRAATAVAVARLRTSAEARVAFAVAFAVCFALYAVGRALQVPYLALAGELGVLFFGLGAAPLQSNRSAGLPARLGVAVLVMLSSMSLLGGLMVLEPLGQPWRPFFWAAAAVAVAALVHALGVRRALVDLRRTGMRLRAIWGGRAEVEGGGWAPLTALILGTAAWVGAAIMAGHITAGTAGFLPHIPPLWYVGVATLLASVYLARGKREAYIALAVVSLTLALTVTPALVYAMPRSQSAAKHIEFVQLILAAHRVRTGSGIYATYSAFFAGIAWLCSVARVTDAAGLATWWPVLIGLLGLAELRFLMGRAIPSIAGCWVAVMVAVLVNAVGQDYFSPQSIGFVMGLGIYALVLARGGPPPVSARLRNAVLVFSGCALATTHELSPFIVGGVLVVLALFRLARPRWAAVAVLVPATIWAGVNYDVVSGFVSFSFLLHLSNFRPPRTVATPGLARELVVRAGSYALLLGLLVLIIAALIGFWRHRRESWAWAFLLCAGVGLICVAASPYGNEGIFRASLFGIPWLVLVAARAFDGRLRRRTVLALAGVSLLLCGTFLVSTFSLDASNVVRPADLAALRTFERVSPVRDSYLLEMGYGSFPTTVPTLPVTRRYYALPTVLGRLPWAMRPSADDLATLTQLYENLARSTSGPGGELYVEWSPAMVAYGTEYGLMTGRQAAAWRDLLVASPDWQVVYAERGTVLLRLVHG
ncbi:MAG TPA: hypothetical protein VL117_00945 [Thermoleophilia bacterium]|nr:hypothetical protein [Thermoleophilia bacterium]